MGKYVDFTAKEGGRYKIFLDGIEVSQHNQERELHEKLWEILIDNPGANVEYIHEYEVMVQLTTQGITLGDLGAPPVNQPPVVDSTPSPSFIEGTPDTYDVGANFSDPDGDILTFTIQNILPNGLTFNGTSGILTYDGVGIPSISAHTATADDGEFQVVSPGFNISIVGVPVEGALGFPRIGTVRIGSRAYAEDNSVGEEERAAIALCDVVHLGLFNNGPWDNNDAAYLTRDQIYVDIKARNPNIMMFDYTNVMETSSTSGEFANKLYGETGPPGAEAHWDAGPDEEPFNSDNDPVNDWWARDGNGRVGSFGNAKNTNITDYVTPDAQGRRWPEFYAETRQRDYIDRSVTLGFGPDGINIFCDVLLEKPKRNQIDYNGDGRRNNCRSFYDPSNNDHMIGDLDQFGDPVDAFGYSVEAAGKWRQGGADYLNKIKNDNPGILVSGENPGWGRFYRSIDPADARPMWLEYTDLVHGGHLNNMSNAEGDFPHSGVTNTGVTHSGNGGGHDFQEAINSYTYCMDNILAPKLALFDFHVYCTPLVSNSPQNRARRPINPDNTGTAFNLVRWALCAALMEDGYICISAHRNITGGNNFSGSPQFDEFGTVNQVTTGLTKGWLGQPIDTNQRLPYSGTLFKREFENGIAIFNSEWDDTQPAQTVQVADIGSGLYKRIDGQQDTNWNDGSVVDANFNLNPIEGIVLERVADPTRNILGETTFASGHIKTSTSPDGDGVVRDAGFIFAASKWGAPITITNITNANPAIATFTGTMPDPGIATGSAYMDAIGFTLDAITSGMTQLSKRLIRAKNVSGNTFECWQDGDDNGVNSAKDVLGNTSVDATGYGTWSGSTQAQSYKEIDSGSESTWWEIGSDDYPNMRVVTSITPPDTLEGSANEVLPLEGNNFLSHQVNYWIDHSRTTLRTDGVWQPENKPRNQILMKNSNQRMNQNEVMWLGFSIHPPSNMDVNTNTNTGDLSETMLFDISNTGTGGGENNLFQIHHQHISGDPNGEMSWVLDVTLDGATDTMTENTKLASMTPDIGLWTSFVLKIFPHATNGIFQVWKSNGPYLGGANPLDRAMVLVYDRTGQPVGFPPPSGFWGNVLKQYKHGWHHGSTSPTNRGRSFEQWFGFSSIRWGTEESHGTTFQDVHPFRRLEP